MSRMKNILMSGLTWLVSLLHVAPPHASAEDNKQKPARRPHHHPIHNVSNIELSKEAEEAFQRYNAQRIERPSVVSRGR